MNEKEKLLHGKKEGTLFKERGVLIERDFKLLRGGRKSTLGSEKKNFKKEKKLPKGPTDSLRYRGKDQGVKKESLNKIMQWQNKKEWKSPQLNENTSESIRKRGPPTPFGIKNNPNLVKGEGRSGRSRGTRSLGVERLQTGKKVKRGISGGGQVEKRWANTQTQAGDQGKKKTWAKEKNQRKQGRPTGNFLVLGLRQRQGFVWGERTGQLVH